MSKLDNLITEHSKSCFGEISVRKDEAFKHQIKDLMLKLIGDEYEDRPDGVDKTCYRLTKRQVKQKVSEL